LRESDRRRRIPVGSPARTRSALHEPAPQKKNHKAQNGGRFAEPREGANRPGEGSIMRRTPFKSLLLHRFIAESPVIEPMVEEWFRAAVQQMLKRI